MSEPERLIDLRSDTVTRPSPEMRRAMAEAEVGDDVLGDDPTVIRLQEFAAELFGKEAGLYMPSGTMTNQVALHAQTTAGDEIFLHAKAHIVENEQGGAAVLSGLQTRTFDSDDGTLDLDLLEHYFHKDDDVHHPAHDTGGRGEHPQLLRRRGLSVREDRRAARLLRPARHDPAPRRRSHLQRRRGLGRGAARHRRALRLGERLPVEGAGRPGRFGAARQRRR